MQILKKRDDFLRLRKGRTASASGYLLAVRDRKDGGPHCRVGFTVTKKLGNAVTRNRIRRRLKEAARLAFPHSARAGCDYVLIGRRGALSRPFAELLDDMKRSLLSLSETPK